MDHVEGPSRSCLVVPGWSKKISAERPQPNKHREVSAIGIDMMLGEV